MNEKFLSAIQRNVFLLIFFFTPFIIQCQISEPADSFYVANWNVENLFDVEDDPLKNDSEFLPESDKQWTEDRLEKKLNNLTRVINYMNNGCGPDILGVEEIENINVLKFLSYKIKDHDYIIAHRESPDERGIDAALIYDRSKFDIVKIDTLRVNLPTNYNTRFILQVTLKHKASGENVNFFVNHWPSRRGGEEKSEKNRFAAAEVLKARVELLKKNGSSSIIIMGDFNDEPNNLSLTNVLSASKFECNNSRKNFLLNTSFEKFEEGIGSYNYRSDWNMLDQIIISNKFQDGKGIEYVCDSFEVIKPPFAIASEGNRKGAMIPTYSGKKYIGGYSDHFPVGAKFYYLKK